LNGKEKREYVAMSGTRPKLREGILNVERHGNPSGELQPVPVHVYCDPASGTIIRKRSGKWMRVEKSRTRD
jgi:hypothetical protein